MRSKTSTERSWSADKTWTTAFLGITAAPFIMELYAIRSRGKYATWTRLVATHVPKPVAYVATGALAVWLPMHWRNAYRRHGGTSS